jgi:hypothetical protein
MTKFWKITGLVTVLVAVVALVGVTAAFAQGPNQPNGATPPRMNQAQPASGEGMGLMAVDEATMHAAIAEALELSIEEFEAALAEGKTPAILALELGVDFAEVQAAMDAVRTEAFQQAIDDGLITPGAGRPDSQPSLGNDSPGRMGQNSGNNGSYDGECLNEMP